MNENTFKIGDTLRCVTPGGCIKVGQLVTVVDLGHKGVKVVLRDSTYIPGWYSHKRFMRVIPEFSQISEPQISCVKDLLDV